MHETTLITPKQQAQRIIDTLPDNADMEEIMYRLYVLENIQRGREDAVRHKGQTAEELLREIQGW